MSDLANAVKSRFGIDSFRPGQFEILKDLVSGHNVCASIPTGAGKSLTYQALAFLTKSIVVVVEPYISLIRDQLSEARQLNLPAASIHSDMTESEVSALKEQIGTSKLRLLFVTPERFQSSDFIHFLMSINVGRIVIDEAHAIISMGEGFRPAYNELSKCVVSLNNARYLENKAPIPIAFLSATLTNEAVDSLSTRFELRDVKRHIIRTRRDNIRIGIEYIATDKKILRALQLAKQTSHYGATLIYVSCKNTARTIFDRFEMRGLPVGLHHASLTSVERVNVLEWFKQSSNGILITTSALSAGFNKSNIRTVIHYHPTRTIEDYTQEIGRAGRDGDSAEAFCFYDPIVDDKLNMSLIKGSSPGPELIAAFAFFVAEKLETHHSLRITADRLKVEYGMRDITTSALRTLLAHAKSSGALDYMEQEQAFEVTLFSRIKQSKLIEQLTNNNNSNERYKSMLALLEAKGCKHEVIASYFNGDKVTCNTECSCCYKTVGGPDSVGYSALSDNAIRTKLNELRSKKSKAFGIPAFALLTAQMIERVIELKPHSVEALNNSGILDANRLAFIGEDLIKVIHG